MKIRTTRTTLYCKLINLNFNEQFIEKNVRLTMHSSDLNSSQIKIYKEIKFTDIKFSENDTFRDILLICY